MGIFPDEQYVTSAANGRSRGRPPLIRWPGFRVPRATSMGALQPPSGEMEAMANATRPILVAGVGARQGGARVVSALDGAVVDGLGGELDA